MWKAIRSSNAFLLLKKSYNYAFKKNLFVTNTLTYVTLYGVGDFVEQSVENFYHKKTGYDFNRTKCMILFACCSGPINHFWYVGLDKFIVKGTIHKVVLKKLVADQFIFSPFFIMFFFTGMGFLEGQTFQQSKKEIKEKAWTLYKADCTVWPAVQTFNFYVIPPHLRLLYMNGITLAWNVFLSSIKHSKPDKAPAEDVLTKGEAVPNML